MSCCRSKKILSRSNNAVFKTIKLDNFNNVLEFWSWDPFEVCLVEIFLTNEKRFLCKCESLRLVFFFSFNSPFRYSSYLDEKKDFTFKIIFKGNNKGLPNILYV